ncbi:hypothetical protein DERP_008597 [Dermatophagoides pteronyssinus]|uniref:Uncharacterized protein n=1 Tax=Dermatophagoides pteronyssinus TaxID=6956 RepID=A0ABQ8IWS6_DERPT|nr:hypothetical protein DERP_008597 [Dermatophagoides pteronyssinus]
MLTLTFYFKTLSINLKSVASHRIVYIGQHNALLIVLVNAYHFSTSSSLLSSSSSLSSSLSLLNSLNEGGSPGGQPGGCLARFLVLFNIDCGIVSLPKDDDVADSDGKGIAEGRGISSILTSCADLIASRILT